jgi:S-adenosylmethionine:tRNA ribosyltransferase-isomerase
MKTKDFSYELPEALIAQTPIEPRDHSRLMAIDRAQGAVEHRHFYDLPAYLRAGDVLVINDTRVMPARLIGRRLPGGGACEVLLLRQCAPVLWEALVRPGRRLQPGARMAFGDGRLTAGIEQKTEDGGRIVRFDVADGALEAALDELGQMPLPPYIHEKLADKERYQTVYAREKGSAAAPTAGLHFTPELMGRIAAMGVEIVPVMLHVGLGTFRPVKAESLDQHRMHSEFYSVSQDAAGRINAAKAEGRRVIAVGTTSVRVLESAARDGRLAAGSGWTDIFITPGYRFDMVDGMITNFHLPESTLLMLVSAFLGRERALWAYGQAVREGYRFFSFGDAMLIYGGAAD